MSVREDCRHYLKRSTPTGEAVQRCRINVNQDNPFACPEDCLFFESRKVTSAGWTTSNSEPLSNTGQGLIGLPASSSKRGKKGRKKGR